MQTAYPLFSALPLAAAFFNLLVTKLNKKVADYLAFLVTGTLAVMAVLNISGAPFAYRVGGFPAPWGILLVSDGLSSLMLVIINVIAFLAVIYSTKYMTMYTAKPKYFSLLLLMIAGMNGVVITGDLFNLFVFLEVASFASYALVGFGCEHEELEASFKYLILGEVASTAILFGIAFLYSMTGTLNMPDLARQLEVVGINKAVAFVIAIFIMGFGLKASTVPFHAWLPDAHPSAPGADLGDALGSAHQGDRRLRDRARHVRRGRPERDGLDHPHVPRRAVDGGRRLPRRRPVGHQADARVPFDQPDGVRDDRPRARPQSERAGRSSPRWGSSAGSTTS